MGSNEDFVLRETAQRPPRRFPYALLVTALVVMGLAGYLGYVLYPRFDLPRAAGLGILALAAGAGFASFFSPCAFPLLLMLLARDAGRADRTRIGTALAFAVPFSVGAAVSLLGLGALIGLGGRAIAASVTFTSPAGITIRVVAGALLILLGLIQIGAVRVSFHRVEAVFRPLTRAHARLRRRSPIVGFAVFGFAYVFIGFG